MANDIYNFLKENGLTQKDENTFLKEYSNPQKAKQLYGFFKENGLTQKDETQFYNTYLSPPKSVPTPLSGMMEMGMNVGKLAPEKPKTTPKQPTIQEDYLFGGGVGEAPKNPAEVFETEHLEAQGFEYNPLKPIRNQYFGTQQLEEGYLSKYKEIAPKIQPLEGKTEADKWLKYYSDSKDSRALYMLPNKIDRDIYTNQREIDELEDEIAGMSGRDWASIGFEGIVEEKQKELEKKQKEKQQLFLQRNKGINAQEVQLLERYKHGDLTDKEYKSELTKLKALKEDVFKPAEVKIKETFEQNKSDIAELVAKEVVPKDATPQQALEIYANVLFDRLMDLSDEMGYDQTKTGVMRTITEDIPYAFQRLGDIFEGRSPREQQYDQIVNKLRDLAPVVYLNKLPKSKAKITEQVQDILAPTLKTFQPGMDVGSIQGEKARNIEQTLKEIGIESAIKPEIAERLKTDSDITVLDEFKTTLGTSLGMMGHFALTGNILNNVLSANKTWKALQLLKEEGKVADITSRAAKILNKTPSIGKVFGSALEGGVTYGTTGAIFGASADEATMEGGIFGGVGGSAASQLLNKVTGIFGKATPKFAQVVFNTLGRAGGEITEETMQELVGTIGDMNKSKSFWENAYNVFTDSESGNEFKKVLAEKFPTAGDIAKFVAFTAIMGGGMGLPSAYNDVYAIAKSFGATESDAKVAEQIVNQAQKDVSSAVKVAIEEEAAPIPPSGGVTPMEGGGEEVIEQAQSPTIPNQFTGEEKADFNILDADYKIPSVIAKKAYDEYVKQHRGQSFQTINQRGGFGESELDEYYPQWREEVAQWKETKAKLAAPRQGAPSEVGTPEPTGVVSEGISDGVIAPPIEPPIAPPAEITPTEEVSEYSKTIIPENTSMQGVKEKDLIPVKDVFKNDVPKNNEFGGIKQEERRNIVDNNKDITSYETINAEEIQPTQHFVNKKALKRGEGGKPVLIKWNNGYFVFDGHHRIAADIKAGKENIDAIVIDFDKRKAEQAPDGEGVKQPPAPVLAGGGTAEQPAEGAAEPLPKAEKAITTPQDGVEVELPPAVSGGQPRTFVREGGEWKQRVGRELVPIPSPSIQAQADGAWAKQAPVGGVSEGEGVNEGVSTPPQETSTPSEGVGQKVSPSVQVEGVQPSEQPAEVQKVSEGVDVEATSGFTEGKHLNKMLTGLKGKYGDKKGSAIYDVANRLVNPNKNTIVEIRSNGVVVKEGEKYLLKPFGNTDANSKKWTLYKGIDVTDQFTKPSEPTPQAQPEGKAIPLRGEGESQAIPLPKAETPTPKGNTSNVGGDVKVNKKLALENAEKIDKGNGSHVKNMSMQELKELASDMVANEKEYQDKFDDAQGIYNLTTERIEELEHSPKEPPQEKGGEGATAPERVGKELTTPKTTINKDVVETPVTERVAEEAPTTGIEPTPLSSVEETTKALDKLPEEQGYEIEGMGNAYIKDVASKKLNEIIEGTDLPDNIKAVIRKRFSLNSKGEYSSSIPFDRIVKSGDIQLTKKFIKDVGVEILRDKYGENSIEYSRELEKLNSGVDNYIQSLLDAEESGKPVKTNPEIARVANILTDIQDKFNEADKNTPQTTAEAYHQAKADGSNPELVKAVEDLLTPKTEQDALRQQSATESLLGAEESQPPKQVGLQGVEQENQPKVPAPKGAEKGGAGKVSASKKAAIQDLLPKYDLTEMEAGFLSNMPETVDEDDMKGVKGKMYDKLYNKGYYAYDEKGTSTQTEKAKKFLAALQARQETRRAVKEGTDLFPQEAGIPEVATRDVFDEYQTTKAAEAVEADIDKTAEKAGVKPKNLRDLYNINRELFGQNRLRSLASAIVMDRMVGVMANRAGISKEEMYGRLEFKKVSEKDLPQGIKLQVDAWHGSPYQFDKFTVEKIGTGEGAQAFGWGLYFTDLESIARNYAEVLSGRYSMLQNARDSINKNGKITFYTEKGAEISITENDGFYTIWNDPKEFGKEERKIDYDIQSFDDAYEEAIDYIESVYGEEGEWDFAENISRTLYKVSIHKGKSPDQYTWLEWDKPVNRTTAENIVSQIEKENGEPMSKADRDYTINEYAGYKTNAILYGTLSSQKGGDKAASLFLLNAGIDGIKYPAESIARGATSDNARGFNYVVFDENAVSIEEVIKFQKDALKARGAAMVNMDGTAIIYAITDPNVSTPIHELAHVFEHYLTDNERAIIKSWAKTKGWTTETSEKFARGFEKYLADGTAPTTALEKVFKKFKGWLTDIYNGITGSDIDLELNDDMKALYAKMLGEEIKKAPPKADDGTAKIAEGLDMLAALIGAKKGIVEQDADVLKALKLIAEGITQKLGYEGKKLIKELKKVLADKGHDPTIVDAYTPQLAPQVTPQDTPQVPKNYRRSTAGVPGGEVKSGKKRQFIKRAKKTVEEEIADATTKDIYEPTTNKRQIEAANRIIDDNGHDEALTMLKRNETGLTPGEDFALAQLLVRHFQEAKEYSKAADTIDYLGENSTDAARRLQALTIWNKISPETILAYTAKQNSKKKRANKEKIEHEEVVVKEEIKKAKKIAASSQRVRNKVKSISQRKRILRAKTKNIIDVLDKMKVSVSGKAFDATLGIPIAIWNESIDIIKKAVEAGDKIIDAVEKGIKYVREKQGAFDEDGYRKKFDVATKDAQSPSAIKSTAAALDIKISEIIDKHISEVEEAKKTIKQRLIEEAGLSDKEAAEIEEAIEIEFRKEAERRLNKYNPRKKIDKARKPPQTQWEKILSINNLGKELNKDVKSIVEYHLGMGELSDEVYEEIKRMSDEVQTMPDGFQKHEGVVQMMNYINSSLGNIPNSEVGWSLWYASILSGWKTQVLNAASNALNMTMEMLTTSIEAGVNGDLGRIKYMLNGLTYGLGRGWNDAKSIMKEGYEPLRKTKMQVGHKIDASNPLENPFLDPVILKRIGGVRLRPVMDIAKYVGRLMTAVDVFFYNGLRDMRAMELERQIPIQQGGSEVSTNRSVSEITENISQLRDKAERQADSEGLTGIKKKRRVYEIIEENRFKNQHDLLDQAERFAARATFNYDPEGVLGTMSKFIGQLQNSSNSVVATAARFTFPFTRIVANVLNQQLNYTPIGAARAYGNSEYWETNSEKQRLYIQSILGTTAMFLFAALAASGDDEDDPEFDVTSDGYGDAKQNAVLYRRGWQPNTVKVGNFRFNYQYTPLAIPFSILGRWRDAYKYPHKDFNKEDYMQRVALVMLSQPAEVFNMSFLSGVNGLLDVMSEKKYEQESAFKNYVARSVGSVIPNIVKQTYQIFDPSLYDNSTIKAALLRQTPFAFLGNKKYDIFGDPIKTKTLSRLYTIEKDDKLALYLANNNIKVPGITDKIADTKLTVEEYNRLKIAYGKKLQTLLSENIDIWEKHPPEQVSDLIDKRMELVAKRLRRTMFPQYYNGASLTHTKKD